MTALFGDSEHTGSGEKENGFALEEKVLCLHAGGDEVLDRLKGRLVGASAYLIKPLVTQHLLWVV